MILLSLKRFLLTLTFTHNGGRLKSKLYHKLDDFTFPIVNFLFRSSNIPASPAYGVFISQPIGYFTFALSTVIFKTEVSYWRKLYYYVAPMPSSRSCWQQRNINISNDNRSFPFYVDVFFLSFLRRCVLSFLFT